MPTQALNEEAANAVRTVAVIVPPDPLEYAVFMNGHPGLAFGLIGGAIAGADQVQKSKQYTLAVQAAKFSHLQLARQCRGREAEGRRL